jgi:hypothetical protein
MVATVGQYCLEYFEVRMLVAMSSREEGAWRMVKDRIGGGAHRLTARGYGRESTIWIPFDVSVRS